MLIAIIEDEEDLLELLEFNLKKEGFDVVGFLNTKKVKQFLKEENPDLLIVDRNLPFIEGAKFVKELKEEGYNIPVIFLSAKTKEDEILEGFEVGADDYIKKPFSIKELIARVKAVLKRNQIQTSILSYKDAKLNLQTHTLTIKNTQIPLTNAEFTLLKEFFKSPNKIFTKDEIASILEISNNSVNVAISRLNHKTNLIKSIRGVGYKLQ
jgi:DNA-binding response OmpR family regulator